MYILQWKNVSTALNFFDYHLRRCVYFAIKCTKNCQKVHCVNVGRNFANIHQLLFINTFCRLLLLKTDKVLSKLIGLQCISTTFNEIKYLWPHSLYFVILMFYQFFLVFNKWRCIRTWHDRRKLPLIIARILEHEKVILLIKRYLTFQWIFF